MKKIIDLSLKEIKEKYDFLYTADRYLKQRITDIENKYFQGKKIYHNKGEGSAFLFRYEIQGLLLLLLKLESDDILNDDRTSKKGISVETIDRIIETYRYVNDSDLLFEHEKIVLDNIPNARQEINFYRTIKEFQKAFVRYIFLTVKNYNIFPSERIKSVADMLNGMAGEISYYTIDYATHSVMAQILDAPMIALNRHDSTASYMVENFSIIADAFYSFDSNGICHRKFTLSNDDSCAAMNEQYLELCQRHMTKIKKNFQQYRELSEDEIKADDSLDKIRMELLDFLEEYWNKKYDAKNSSNPKKEINGNSVSKLKNKNVYDINSPNLEVRYSEFKRLVVYYLTLFCKIKSNYFGLTDDEKIVTEGEEDEFSQCIRLRPLIIDFKLFERKIGVDLPRLEQKVWKICRANNGISEEELKKILMIFLIIFHAKSADWKK